MASRDASPITLKSGDKEYTVQFTARAARRIEARTGKTFGAVASEADAMGYTAIAELLKAGLEAHHPDLDEDALDAIIDDVGFHALDGPLGQAMVRDLGKGRTGPQKPSRPRAKRG